MRPAITSVVLEGDLELFSRDQVISLIRGGTFTITSFYKRSRRYFVAIASRFGTRKAPSPRSAIIAYVAVEGEDGRRRARCGDYLHVTRSTSQIKSCNDRS